MRSRISTANGLESRDSIIRMRILDTSFLQRSQAQPSQKESNLKICPKNPTWMTSNGKVEGRGDPKSNASLPASISQLHTHRRGLHTSIHRERTRWSQIVEASTDHHTKPQTPEDLYHHRTTRQTCVLASTTNKQFGTTRPWLEFKT